MSSNQVSARPHGSSTAVPVYGTNGLLSQDVSNFFYNLTTHLLSVLKLDTLADNVWSKQQYYALQTLSVSGGAVTSWSWSTQRRAAVTGSGGTSIAMPFPSSLQPGAATVFLNQSATGGEKFTFSDSRFKQGASLSFLVGNASGRIEYSFSSDGTIITVEARDY